MSLITSVNLSSSQSKDVLIYPEGSAVSVCVLTEKTAPAVASKQRRRPSVCSELLFFCVCVLDLIVLFTAYSFNKGFHLSLCLFPLHTSFFIIVVFRITACVLRRKGQQIHQSTLSLKSGHEELMKKERRSRMNVTL